MFSYKNKANIYNYFNNKGVMLVIIYKIWAFDILRLLIY